MALPRPALKAPVLRALCLAASLVSPISAGPHDEDLAAQLEVSSGRDLVYHVPPNGQGEVFSDEVFAGPFVDGVGLAFDAAERLWVWEKGGRILYVDSDGALAPVPMLDISEEVGNWGGGYGMLGVAFAPDFLSSGYVYVLYVVDHHYLEHFGTPQYDPAADEDYTDTIGRLTRYQVFDPLVAGPDVRANPASRTIMIGADAASGFPICSHTHGVGTLAFGADGSLLASCGDGFLEHTGSGTCYSEGLINDAENVGFFRSQLLDTLSGKILRLDPLTGEGMVDNPFFDALAPNAPRSLVWTLGLRQPYRMSVKPGTGGVGAPGTLFVGDVGSQTWEELNIVTEPAQNFGWPIYEGMTTAFHASSPELNLDAPNPLFGLLVNGELCQQEFFRFSDLLHDETLPGAFLNLPNPCDPAVQVPFKWMHTRPALTWNQDATITHSKAFDPGGNPISETLGEPSASVSGDPFLGSASIGGVWYDGDNFPPAYQDAYYFGDFAEGWIRAVRFDANDQPTEVLSFTNDAGSPVSFATHPSDGSLLYVDYAGPDTNLRRIRFVDNLPPVAKLDTDVTWGPAPLSVSFSAAASFDPEGDALDFLWDFGDGSPTSTEPAPTHVYTSPGAGPATYIATLEVTDSFGVARSDTVLVSPNNSPPSIEILAPSNGAVYSSDSIDVVALTSSITDAEHSGAELNCSWSVVLHHEEHTHPQPLDAACQTTTVTSPHTEDGDTEFVSIQLSVTDAHGLESRVVHYLPRSDDCNLNGYPDVLDIFEGISFDTDFNGVPDECQADCDANGLSDPFEINAGLGLDCNANGVPDACEIAFGSALDLDQNGVPDTCQELSADVATISLSAGGNQALHLAGGPWEPGDVYWVLGSVTGPSPPTPFGDVELPLAAPDMYFTLSLVGANQPPLLQSFGLLDASATADAVIDFWPSSPPGLAGIVLYHAALIIDIDQLDYTGIYDATNWMPVTLVP